MKEREAWAKVKDRFDDKYVELGHHWSYNIYNDPKRLMFVLSRYKFAAKMACKGTHVLELGCSEGIGVPILSEFSKSYTGVDNDNDSIMTSDKNWGCDDIKFINEDFLGKRYGEFDSIISLDVIEHIEKRDEPVFFETIYSNLAYDGICIIGTPNITAAGYASDASMKGHINLFDAGRLERSFKEMFHNVFIFGQNDEVIHTGFAPMAHYLIVVGFCKIKK